MLKRYNHIGKKAAKYKFITSFQELSLNTNEKWKPRQICLEWSRKNRSNKSKEHIYEENHSNRLSGGVIWVVPENIEFNATLFRNKKDTVYEKKEWVLKVLDHDAKGRTKPIAFANFDLSNYSEELKPYNITLTLKLNNKNLTSAQIHFTLNASVLRTGNATDDDMQSQASILYDQEHGQSEDPAPDIANISDFNEDISLLSNEIASFAQDSIDTIPIEGKEEKTPVKEVTIEQQLIDWSNSILVDYKNIRVTNMTTSWRNGLAFCAIVHRHLPDIIDFRSLSAHEIVENNQLAFTICEKEFKIVSKLDPKKMLSSIVPDKLFIMMFVDQLKKYFTAQEFEAPSESSSDPCTEEPTCGSITSTPDHSVQQIVEPAKQFSKIITRNSTNIIIDKNNDSSNPFEKVEDCNHETVEKLSNKSSIKNSTRLKSQSPEKSQLTELKNRARNLLNKKEKTPTKEVKQDAKETKTSQQNNRRDSLDKHAGDSTKSDDVKSSEKNKFKISVNKNCSPVHKITSQPPCSIPESISPTVECRSEVSIPNSVVLLTPAEARGRLHSNEEKVNTTTTEEVQQNSESSIAKSSGAAVSASTVMASPSKKSMTAEERKTDLRNRARMLIAAAKSGAQRSPSSHGSAAATNSSSSATITTSSAVSRTSSGKSCNGEGDTAGNLGSQQPREPATAAAVKQTSKLSLVGEGLRIKTRFQQFRDNKSLSRPTSKISLKKPSSVKLLKENISPERKSSDGYIESEYVKASLSALELEMVDLNEKSNEIENQLRIIMSTNEDKKQEEVLLKELFDNVNKKNTIVKRLEQVNILAKTEDLEKRQELLTIEIGELIVRDDNHVREELLLQELVAIVDKRNALLQASHMYEQSLDEELISNLNTSHEQKEQCSIQ